MNDQQKIDFLKNYVRKNSIEARETQHRENDVDEKYEKLTRLVSQRHSYGCQTSAVKELVKEIIYVTTGEKPSLDEKSKMNFREIHGVADIGISFAVIAYKPSGTTHLLFHEGNKAMKIGLSKDNQRALYKPTEMKKLNFYETYRYATIEEIDNFIDIFNWTEFKDLKVCEALYKVVESLNSILK